MIARTWRRRAPVTKAEAYAAAGVRRNVEFMALTLRESIETIKGFAGLIPMWLWWSPKFVRFYRPSMNS